MLNAWREWCRLCAKERGNEVNIFGDEHQLDLQETIRKHFQITINLFDEPPKLICKSCLKFLLKVVQFSDRCAKVEALLAQIFYNKVDITAADSTSLKAQYGIVNYEALEEEIDVKNPIATVKAKYDSDGDDTFLDFVTGEESGEKKDANCEMTHEVNDPLLVILKEGEGLIEEDDTPLKFSSKQPEARGKRKPAKSIKSKIKADPNIRKKNFICSTCSKSFQDTRDLRRHETVHLPRDMKNLSTCPYCDKKLVCLSEHIRAVHHGERPYVCEECGKTFKTLPSLKEHKYTHTDETPFPCSHCPKMFKNRIRLKVHEKIHSETTFDCPECGLKLNTKRTLTMHMVVHSDEKKFKCNFCGTEFKRSKSLKIHLISHTGLRPYTCPFCDQTFSNSPACRKHKKTAHPEELAALEASGVSQRVKNLPKLEQLISKSIGQMSDDNLLCSRQSASTTTKVTKPGSSYENF